MNTKKNNFKNMTLSEIAIENLNYTEIFEKYGLDFCCNGNVNYSEACKNKGIDENKLADELNGVSKMKNEKENYDKWKLDFLVDYIINNHHHYIVESVPKINEHLKKIVVKHSDNHPELAEITKSFSVVSKELQLHMVKEEKILFPYIKHMVLVHIGKAKNEAPYFGKVENPIRMMEEEHIIAGDIFKKIRELSINYNIPDDACVTFNMTMVELKEFEEDLHKHIHLENNILFPKSIIMEEEILNS